MSVLPGDADAVFAVGPVTKVAPRLSRVLDRLPEATGLFDLVSSLTGVDLLSPDKTGESGIDPNRRIALALWRDAGLMVLPLRDEALGARRIGLRLARLGFLEEEDARDGTIRYRSTRDLEATCVLWVRDRLAWVCMGNAERCPPPRDGSSAGWSPTTVTDELSMPGAVAMGVVRNPLLAHLLDRSGPSLTGTARAMVQALLGDLRWALDAEGGLRARVAAGPVGNPVERGPVPSSIPGDAVAFLSLTLPGAFLGRPLGDALAGLASTRDREVLRGLGAAWSGKAVLAVMADPAAEPAPLVFNTATLGRLDWVAGLSFANAGSAAGAVRALVDLAKRNGWADATTAPSSAGARLVREGLPLELKSEGIRVVAGSRKADLKELPLGLADTRVMHLAADPRGLLKVLGGGGVEFLRHMVAAVPMVFVDLKFELGRPILDAGVVIP